MKRSLLLALLPLAVIAIAGALLVNKEGRAPLPLPCVSPTQGIDPSWSPDGRRIIYCEWEGDPPDLPLPPSATTLTVWTPCEGASNRISITRDRNWDLLQPWWVGRRGAAYGLGARCLRPLEAIGTRTVASRRIRSEKQVWQLDLRRGDYVCVWKAYSPLSLRWNARHARLVGT